MSGFWTNSQVWTSQDDTWRTPIKLYKQLDEEFGFTLDAAALQSSTLVPDNWYGPDHPDETRRDGLARDWHKDTSGTIWLNPPYGRNVTSKWLEKANQEKELGAKIVCLIPSRTSTKWFQTFCLTNRVRFISGRLKFNEGAKDRAPFDSALVLMQKDLGPGYF